MCHRTCHHVLSVLSVLWGLVTCFCLKPDKSTCPELASGLYCSPPWCLTSLPEIPWPLPETKRWLPRAEDSVQL